MMLRSSVSCLYSSGNQVTFQGLHFEEKLSSQSRQGHSCPEHILGNFQVQSKHSSVVCYSSNSRFKSATLSQSRESYGRRWVDSEANITSSFSGHEEEVELPFWERLKEAWRVLTGAPQNSNVKDRFSRLLIRDRGFNSTNLSRLYNAARGAIEQHVELEEEEHEPKSIVQKLGEVQLYFRVRRLKSDLLEETYSDETDMDFQPPTEPHLLWEENLPPTVASAEGIEDVSRRFLSPQIDMRTPEKNVLEEEDDVNNQRPAPGIRQRWQTGASDRSDKIVARLSNSGDYEI